MAIWWRSSIPTGHKTTELKESDEHEFGYSSAKGTVMATVTLYTNIPSADTEEDAWLNQVYCTNCIPKRHKWITVQDNHITPRQTDSSQP